MAEENAGTTGLPQALDDLFGTLEGTDESPAGTGDTAAETVETQTTAGETEAPQEHERLMDPATLPDELKPHWRRMTQAYNKRLTDLREREKTLGDLGAKAAQVDRFYSDPTYATEVLHRMADTMGMTLVPRASSTGDRLVAPPGTTGPSGTQTAASADVPPALIQRVQQLLADTPDLQFLAPVLAKAAYAVSQETVAPLQRERATERQQQEEQQYEAMSTELTARQPGWEEYEDEMVQRLGFLRQALNGGPKTHPTYGSVLDMLYQWSTAQATSTAEAGRRMQRALTNRTTTGTAGRSAQPSVQELIQKAPTFRDKIGIAFQEALSELRNR